AVQYLLKAIANPTPTQVTSPSKTVKPIMPGNARMSGKEIYDATCASCHLVGIAKAPRLGNKLDWESRISKLESALVLSVINGFNVMPPRGGNNNLNDEEIKLAVQYMLEAVK
ncbi:c-type cytochrome, partial [Thiotrichales bacterium HSG1]|nr:c-type cytochrome [Thiotrichales bacterium HSG1]